MVQTRGRWWENFAVSKFDCITVRVLLGASGNGNMAEIGRVSFEVGAKGGRGSSTSAGNSHFGPQGRVDVLKDDKVLKVQWPFRKCSFQTSYTVSCWTSFRPKRGAQKLCIVTKARSEDFLVTLILRRRQLTRLYHKSIMYMNVVSRKLLEVTSCKPC